MQVIDYNKYENYIRVGSSPDNLQNFPTPSSIGVTHHDLDKDAFTDLEGYTHRNRVRHDVLDLTIGYKVVSDSDKAFILNALSPEWIYVEVKDAKTLQRSVHKMYASDKQSNTFKVFQDNNGNWQALHEAFSFSLIEQ